MPPLDHDGAKMTAIDTLLASKSHSLAIKDEEMSRPFNQRRTRVIRPTMNSIVSNSTMDSLKQMGDLHKRTLTVLALGIRCIKNSLAKKILHVLF